MGMMAAKAAENQQKAVITYENSTKGMVQKMMDRGEIAKALPNVGITPERFTRLIFSALSTTPKLAECDRGSFLGAMMQSAQLGLEPNTPLGQAYLIPYGKTVQFQLGYKGLLELAYRSGKISTIYAETIYENDEYTYEMGFDAKLIHKPKMDGPRGKAVAYYAVYKTVDGQGSFTVMSAEDVRAFAQKKSKSYGNGPWQTDFDAMAKKTVLKRLLKYAPISTELQRATAADETVKSSYTIGEDILDVQEDPIVTEGQVSDEVPSVDPETGEILQEA